MYTEYIGIFYTRGQGDEEDGEGHEQGVRQYAYD